MEITKKMTTAPINEREAIGNLKGLYMIWKTH